MGRALAAISPSLAFSGYEDALEGKIHFAGDFNPNFQGFMEGGVSGAERAAGELRPNG